MLIDPVNYTVKEFDGVLPRVNSNSEGLPETGRRSLE